MTLVRPAHLRRHALWLLMAVPIFSAAQSTSPIPNAGQLLQQAQPVPQPTRSPSSTGLKVLRPDGQSMPASTPFEVKTIAITGNTLIATETLQVLVADALGKQLALAQLDELAGRLTAAYQRAGQPLARAIVPAQTIEQGRVTLRVIEARFGQVKLNNGSRNGYGLLQGTLAAMAPGELVSQDRLDHALLRLADIPGITASATLAPGTAVGSSDVLVDVQGGPAHTGQVTLDDQGSRSTGRARLTGVVNLLNPLGLGDVLTASVLTSGKGMQYARAGYEWLAHGSGTRVNGTASTLRYELMGDLAALQAHGTATVFNLGVRQPLVRRGNLNLSASLNLDRTQLRDHVDSSGLATDRTLSTASLGLQGDRADNMDSGGMEGVTLVSVTVSHGHVRFDDVVAEQVDEVSARTAGAYTKWTLSLARQQALWGRTSLYASLYVQGAGGNLDASQKLSAGGPNAVRGYDTGVAPGDQGQVLSVELRQALPIPGTSQWQAALFADAAHIDTNHQPWAAATATNSYSLRGAGLGLAVIGQEGWQARLSVARPLGELPTGMTASRSTRAWLDLTARF